MLSCQIRTGELTRYWSVLMSSAECKLEEDFVCFMTVLPATESLTWTEML